MAQLTAKQAAEAVGMTKAGLLKAVHKGRVSGQRTDTGEWRFDAAEIFRAFPPAGNPPITDDGKVDNRKLFQDMGLQAEIEGLRKLVDTLEGERDDLRRRLDQEGQERRQLTAILTDQRAQDARRSIWSKLWGR